MNIAELPDREIRAQLLAYGKHIAKPFSEHLMQTILRCKDELEGKRCESQPLRQIMDKAAYGARAEFKAAFTDEPPNIPIDIDTNIDDWRVARNPHLLVIILQEWFFNSLKECVGDGGVGAVGATFTIKVLQVRGRSCLQIESPHAIAERYISRLSPDFASEHSDDHVGLNMIRELLSSGFDTAAECAVSPQGHTRLTIPLPLNNISAS